MPDYHPPCPLRPTPEQRQESERDAECETGHFVRLLLEILRDKWRTPVLLVLIKGTMRYGQLSGHIPDISRTMLTRTLRDLEHGGLVKRRIFVCVPPKVEYTLTNLGHTLAGQIRAMDEWARTHEAKLRIMHDNFGREPLGARNED